MPAISVSPAQQSMLKADIASFNRDMARFRLAYLGSTVDYLKEVVMDFLARVIEYTPVRTGRAAMGWYAGADAVGIGAECLDRADAGSATDQAEQEQGRTEGRYEEHLTGLNKWILVANGVPYILALEFGTSTQGGHFMLRRALAEIKKGLVSGWQRFVKR